MKPLSATFCLLIFALIGCDTSSPSDAEPKPGEKVAESNTDAADSSPREFEFKYAAEIVGVPEGATVKVWIPIAESSPQQEVELVEKTVPAELQMNRDKTYGNQIGFFEFAQNKDNAPVAFSLNYKTARTVAGLDDSEKSLDDSKTKTFLDANRLVPKTGRPIELLAEKSVPSDAKAAGELLYEIVENHMKYDKSQPGYGNGDSVWACDSKTGNCTDFHSLFISLARSQNIPARFQIGFPLPPQETSGKIGGYHCWAWFHIDGQGWLPVDISEADKHPEMKEFYCGNLTNDRIAFSTGRDIKLEPKSETESLNYFVYPHVEVDGKPWPKDKIKLDFSFANTTESSSDAK